MVAVAGDGTVLGVAWVRLLRGYGHVDDDTPELSIAVAEAHRGRGIGSALHATMLDWFATQPLDTLWLGTDPHSRAYGFYLAHDWMPVGRQDGEDVRLERTNSRNGRPATR